MACRDCKFLEVRPDTDGKVRIRKGYMYKCTVAMPIVPLPRSVRGLDLNQLRNVRPGRMEPDEGDDCFYHEKRNAD